MTNSPKNSYINNYTVVQTINNIHPSPQTKYSQFITVISGLSTVITAVSTFIPDEIVRNWKWLANMARFHVFRKTFIEPDAVEKYTLDFIETFKTNQTSDAAQLMLKEILNNGLNKTCHELPNYCNLDHKLYILNRVLEPMTQNRTINEIYCQKFNGTHDLAVNGTLISCLFEQDSDNYLSSYHVQIIATVIFGISLLIFFTNFHKKTSDFDQRQLELPKTPSKLNSNLLLCTGNTSSPSKLIDSPNPTLESPKTPSKLNSNSFLSVDDTSSPCKRGKIEIHDLRSFSCGQLIENVDSEMINDDDIDQYLNYFIDSKEMSGYIEHRKDYVINWKKVPYKERYNQDSLNKRFHISLADHNSESAYEMTVHSKKRYR